MTSWAYWLTSCDLELFTFQHFFIWSSFNVGLKGTFTILLSICVFFHLVYLLVLYILFNCHSIILSDVSRTFNSNLRVTIFIIAHWTGLNRTLVIFVLRKTSCRQPLMIISFNRKLLALNPPTAKSILLETILQ